MYSSQQIADWFIAHSRAGLRAGDDKVPVTIGQLNLLMYFAQGVYFKWYGKPLFDDELKLIGDNIIEDRLAEGSIFDKLHSKYSNNVPIVFDDVSESRATELAKNYDYITQKDREATKALALAWYELKIDYLVS